MAEATEDSEEPILVLVTVLRAEGLLVTPAMEVTSMVILIMDNQVSAAAVVVVNKYWVLHQD